MNTDSCNNLIERRINYATCSRHDKFLNVCGSDWKELSKDRFELRPSQALHDLRQLLPGKRTFLATARKTLLHHTRRTRRTRRQITTHKVMRSISWRRVRRVDLGGSLEALPPPLALIYSIRLSMNSEGVP